MLELLLYFTKNEDEEVQTKAIIGLGKRRCFLFGFSNLTTAVVLCSRLCDTNWKDRFKGQLRRAATPSLSPFYSNRFALLVPQVSCSSSTQV